MCSITLANLPSAKANQTESTQRAGRVLGGPTVPVLRNGVNVRQANVGEVSVFCEVKLLLFCFTEALSKVKASQEISWCRKKKNPVMPLLLIWGWDC